ncbi:transaldolase [Candidatus Dojkabacteria bacterium]|jgi:transaldolase|nr:transaldolase [Candidatus Dojkabacteria bacterium]
MVKIFADGADKKSMIEMYNNPLINGLTTNPTLMRKAGISNYKEFAIDILSIIKDKPISFEVFSDDLNDMEKQALEISSWGKNVYVKIPITNTKGESTYNVISNLSKKSVNINVTAITNIDQINFIKNAVLCCKKCYISIFAGRIADTGVDPVPIIKEAIEIFKYSDNVEILWASCREVYNIKQADDIGCHIITVTDDILKKFFKTIGKDLNAVSLETVNMFYNDALQSGYLI